jgi:hypothetical protein
VCPEPAEAGSAAIAQSKDVIAGLVPAIPTSGVLALFPRTPSPCLDRRDGRDKPGHDGLL